MSTTGDTYLIKAATVFRNHLFAREKKDILIQDGIITAMEDHIAAREDCRIIDAQSMFVSAGWLDSHAHVFQNGESIGVSADSMLHSGVTAVLDAGTTGAYNFAESYHKVIKTSNIQVKAYLHIGKWGISDSYSELRDMNNIDTKACIETCARYPKEILGLKARIDQRVCEDEKRTLQKLRYLGDVTGKRIVLHASRCHLSLDEILPYFKKGDIFAHSYADKSPGLVDGSGRVKKAVWEAKEKSVLFDLSHGNNNFSFPVGKRAVQQGFTVDTISTDLHTGSKDKVGDMAAIMTKLITLGLSLEEVLERVITIPASIMELEDYMTGVFVGQPASLTAFRVEEGVFELFDCDGNAELAHQRIKPVFTMLGDQIYMAGDDPV